MVETLEDRLAPATFIWTGASGSLDWSNAGNWAGGAAPSAAAPGAELVFGQAGAGHLTSNNNIDGLIVKSIQFSSLTNYNLTGKQIDLGNRTQFGSTVALDAGLNATIDMDLSLAASSSNQQVFTVESGATLTIASQITGITGSQLTKGGTGTLRLTEDNATYLGPFNIQQDSGVVRVEHAKALGGPRTSAVQLVQLTGATTATQFRLRFGTAQTAPITYTGTQADGAAVKLALEGLSTFTPGGVAFVTQTNAGGTESFVITLGGSLAGVSQSLIAITVTAGPGAANSVSVLQGGLTGPNVVTVGNNSQLQLNNVTGGSIANSLQLSGPGFSNTGTLMNAAGNSTWSGPIALASTNTSFNVATGTNLTVTGVISDLSSPFNLTKFGAGTLILSNANTYRGTTQIQNGMLTIRHPLALGAVPTAGTFTLVNTISGERGSIGLEYTLGNALPPNNAQYYNLQDPTLPYSAGNNPYVGFTVPNYTLRLLGGGLTNNTSLENIAGLNGWTGPIIVNGTQPGFTSAFLRITADSLRISGVISDVSLTQPAGIVKEGPGTLILSPSVLNASGLATAQGRSNLFNGVFTINAGIVQLEDSQGLGPATNFAGTVVNSGAVLELISNIGHVDSVTNSVNRLRVSEPLTISGTGINSQGALRSISGINTYTNTFVPTPVQNAIAGITGGNLNTGTTYFYIVTAIDGYGESLPSNQRSFTATAGSRTARISWTQVPGATGYRIYRSTNSGSFTNPSLVTVVTGGATLFFEDGSATTLTGAPATMQPVITAIGSASIDVQPEPTPTNNANYFTNDYSLTIDGGIRTPASPPPPAARVTLTKVGAGHLILPNANLQFLSDTTIADGWITVQSPQSLGPSSTDVQETEALVRVDSGALHLKPLVPGTSFNFTHNLRLQGSGITHPFSLINNMGAITNLEGANTLSGNVVLGGNVGIGVEDAFRSNPADLNQVSHLTMTGEVSQDVATLTIAPNFSGTGQQHARSVDVGSTSGLLTLNAFVHMMSDDVRIYLGNPILDPGNARLIYDAQGDFVSTQPNAPIKNQHGANIVVNYTATSATITVTHILDPGPGGPFGGGPQMGANWYQNGGVPYVETYAPVGGAFATYLTIVVNPGGNPSPGLTVWNYRATIEPGVANGGITKLGSQRLDLMGTGLFTGSVDVTQGVVRVLNENALGRQADNSFTYVRPGAALELAPTDPSTNGGQSVGGSFWNTKLVLEGTGNAVFGDAALEVLSNDVLWHGPISLKSNFTVQFEGALANQAINTLTPVTTDTGGAPTLTGSGASLSIVTSTPGGGGFNAVQTLIFGGTVTGGFFRLSYNNGTTTVTTANINYSADPAVLIANIIARLTSVLGAGNFNVVKANPTINVHPNARFVVAGTIDDGVGGGVTTSSPLIHDYQFNGNFNDALGGPALVPTGGTVSATNYSWNRVVEPPGLNEGLTLTNALPTPDNYSIELVFKFNSFFGTWSNIIEFKNRTSDQGLYAYSGGFLQFYSSPQSAAQVFTPNVNAHLVITRDSATNQFVAYVNGVQQLAFDDSSGRGIFSTANNLIHFFIDDTVFSNEVSPGSVEYIKIYSRAVTSTEVTTLYNAGAFNGTLGGTATVATGMPSDLVMNGGGSLYLSGANMYRGGTFMNHGVLTLANPQGLGGLGIFGAHNLQLTNAVAGSTQFRLGFGSGAGSQTAAITYTGTSADAVNIRNALNGLTTISGPGGNVTVIDQGGGLFLITFGGTMTGAAGPTFASQVTAGSGSIVATPAGGTYIADRAQLQLEGGINVAGEPLTLAGTGANLTSSVQTFTVNTTGLSPTGTYTLNFNGADTAPLSYLATAGQVRLALQNLPTVKNVAGLVGVNLGNVDPGRSETQKFSFMGFNVNDTYQLYFDPAAGTPTIGHNLTPAIAYSGNAITDRDRINAALRALRTVGGVGGTTLASDTGMQTGGLFTNVIFHGTLANRPLPLATATVLTGTGTLQITRTTAGAPGTRTFTVTFMGSFAHQNQPLLTVPQTTGTTTLTTPSNVVVGGLPDNTPTQWFAQGPAPITDAVVFASGGALQNATGRVTGVAVMSTFADNILISTSGGGFWETIDGGQHWTPLFDSVNNSVMFGGAIAASASPSPSPVYFGTGEGNNSIDSYYGSGVYKNGVLLTDPVLGNPLAGKGINKIAINPANTFMIWAGVTDFAINGTSGNAGVWRYNGVNWLNTTAAAFPTTAREYMDAVYDSAAGILYSAVGDSFLGGTSIIRSTNPDAAAPTWASTDVAALFAVPAARIGNIKIAVSGPNTAVAAVEDTQTRGILGIIRTTTGGGAWTVIATVGGTLANLPGNYLRTDGWYANAIVASGATIYVAGTDTANGTNFVLRSVNSGTAWTDVSKDATNEGPNTGVHALALDSSNRLIAGTDGGVWRYDPNLATPDWFNLNGDLEISQLAGVAVQPGNTGVILGGTYASGVVRTDGTSQSWTQVSTGGVGLVRFVPGAPNVAYQVVRNTASSSLLKSVDAGESWSGALRTVTAVLASPVPLAVDIANPQRVLIAGGTVPESLDQGTSFTNLANVPIGQVEAIGLAAYQGPYLADPAFPNVADAGSNTYVPDTIYLAGGTDLRVTKNHGLTWSPNRAPTLPLGTFILDIQVDPSNSNVVYFFTEGLPTTAGTGRVFKSVNAGLTWTDISAGLPVSAQTGFVLPAWKLVIDYRTNDLYLGTDEGVWKLAAGAGVWTRFGQGLPIAQVKDLDLSPRGNILTAGTYGRGVWQYHLNDLTGGVSANPGALRSVGGDNTWTGPITLATPTRISATGSQALQDGLSGASLTVFGNIGDLPGTTNNTLTKIGGGDVIFVGANTYAGVTDIREGNILIRNPDALGGAAVAGTQALSVFVTPPTVLAAPTLSTGGAIANGTTFFYQVTALSAAGESIASNEVAITTNAANQAIVLNWAAVDGATSYRVYRSTAPAPYVSPTLLTTIGSRSVTTYTDTGTAVSAGAPAQSFQVSFSFNGFTSAPITYTGTSADAANIQSLLNAAAFATIGGIGDSVTVTQTGPGFFVIKFNGPTLSATTLPILAIVTNGSGFASTTPGGGTIVENGAALVLQSSLNPEPITLNGNGIAPNYGGHHTGALRSLSNSNTYTGTITLNTDATIGVDTGSSLTIASVNPHGIIDNGRGFSLTKEGDGRLTLASADNYGSATAGTTVEQGVLNVQHSGALGVPGSTTLVRDGAQLQLESPAGPVQNDPVVTSGGTIPSGTTFFYQITAIGPSGETLASNEKSITTSAPGRQVELSWSAIPGATGYKVYRSTTAGPFTSPALLTTIGAGSTTNFIDTGLAVSAGAPPTGTVHVTTENLILSGSGIGGTGALLNVAGNNSWGSATTTVALTSAPSFAQLTMPAGTVAFGVANAGETLTINGSVVQPAAPSDAPTTGPLPSGLTKVGPGRLTLAQNNSYSGTTYINNGTLRITHSNALGTNTGQEIQRVTVFDALGTGQFTLTFGGATTGQLTFALPGSGGVGSTASVQNALQALPSIGVGNVSVTRSTITVNTPNGPQIGYIYSVTFIGALAQQGQALLAGTPTGGLTLAVHRVADGGIGTLVNPGTSLELDNNISTPAAESLMLNGTGVGNLGALHNIAGTNTWNGKVTLQTSSTVSADPGSKVVIAGVLQDPTPTSVPPPNLTKIGTGSLSLTSANTYTGHTFVQQGVLNIQHPLALGLNTSSVQTVTVLGTSGTFTLFYNGTPIATPLNFGATAAQVKAALDPLVQAANATNFVTVTQLGDTYTIAFNGGALAGTSQTLLAATFTAGVSSVDVEPILIGASAATIVSSGAGLQLEHATSFTQSSTKKIFLNGPGFNGGGALENVAGTNTASINPIILASDASIGADGASRLIVDQPITDQFQRQTITFNGFATGNTYTLSFDGQVSASITFSNNRATNASRIAAALNALGTITLRNGSVTVPSTGVGTTFEVNFGGRMIGTNWPLIVGTATSGTGTFSISRTMVSAPFDLDKVGTGTVEYAGATDNAYSGVTHVIAGTLELNKSTTNTALIGDAVVGSPGGAPPGSAVLRQIGATEQIANGADVLVNIDGLYDVNGRTETFTNLSTADGQATTSANGALTVTNLNMTGGTLTTVAGGAGVTVTGGVTGTSSATGAGLVTGNGTFLLSAAAPTITVNDGPQTTDLLINAVISTSGAPTLTRAGAGRLELGAVNAYTGPTRINAGDVQVDVGASIANVQLSGGSLSGRGTVGTVTMFSAASTGTVNPGYNGAPIIGTLTTGNVTWTSNATYFADLHHTSVGVPVAGVDNDLLNVVGSITLGNALLLGGPVPGVVIGDQFTIIQSSIAMNAGGIASGVVPANALDGIIAGVRAPIAQDGTVFLNGQKFTLHYFSNSVVLTRQYAVFTSLTMTSSANPSKYGQEVTYTITAVPEPGATLTTANPRVTLSVDAGVFTRTVTMNQVTGIATFTPQTDFDFVWGPTVPPAPNPALPPHVIAVEFNDLNDVFASNQIPVPSPINQVIQQNTVGLTLSSSPVVTATAPVFAQTVNITATILPDLIPNVPNASNPTGTVTFIIDPGTPGQMTFSNIALTPPYVDPPASRSATLTLPGNLFLSPGEHLIRASYNGDTNYAASATPTEFTLDIKSDNTVTTITPVPTSSNLGQNATFNVQVSPVLLGSLGTPVGTVNLYDGSTSNPPLNPTPIQYSGSSVSYQTSNLLLGTHQIFAVFTPATGNLNYNGSQTSINFTVSHATTTTSIVSVQPAAPSFGTPATFTLKVEPTPTISSGFGLPTGTITLWDGVPNVGVNLGTGAVNSANGETTVTTTAFGLSVGTHTLNAVYSGDGVFGTSTGTSSVTISAAPTSVAVSASPSGGANFGTSVQLQAIVTSPVGTPPTGVGAGSRVTIVDTTVSGSPINLGTGNLAAGGIATINTSILPAGSRTITATYTDTFDNNFASSSGELAGYVISNAPTSTVVSVDVPSGTGVYGQPVTFTATVTSPGGPVTTGAGSSVRFVDTTTGATLGNADIVAGAGNTRIAALTVNTLSAGSHNITATYTNTANTFFTTSSGNLNNYVVLAASTTIASFTSSPTISALGQTVTFTATVSANAPSTALVNGGNVTFRDITGAPVTLGTSPVSGSGVATLNVSSLSLGLHTIEAVYAGSSPNFNASPAVTLTQDVRKAATINVSPIAGAVFGQPLTYAITVTGTPGTPTGTVTILEGLATLGSNTLSSGATSINIGPLTAGTHNLVFEYSGDTVPAFGFAPTSRTIVQTVAAAGTTTTLAPLPARFFGEPVTLTATITTNAPSLAAAPTAGTVSFFDGATLLQAMPLSGSNIAIYQTSTLSVGTHTITAVYTGGLPSYANSFTTGTQTINGVATTTTLLPLSPTTYGNAVTFNVTVAPTTGAAVPTGTVAFRAGTTVLGTRTLANGAASFTTTPTQLAAGNHSITVVYTPSTTSFGGSTSPAQNQAVAAASTVTTVTSSAASGSVFGNAVTFTAIVTVTSGGSPGVPTGFALFYDGAVPLSGVVALTNGRATFTTSTLAAGLHNIRAYYAPNPANFVSTFGALTQNVAAASTATVLTSLPPFWAINQAVTFSATVGATSGGSPGTPTGTVTFVIDGVSQTPVALSGGRATFTHTFTTLGNHSVSAIYTPNTANFNGSAAGTQQQNVRRPSSLVISSQSFPAYVNIGANVTALSGGGVPTGTVSFYELLNGVAILLGTAPLNSNGATAILADLATGSHTIRAVYSGDAIFSPTVSTAVVQGKTNGRVV